MHSATLKAAAMGTFVHQFPVVDIASQPLSSLRLRAGEAPAKIKLYEGDAGRVPNFIACLSQCVAVPFFF
jgi:hypothetical protein